MTSKKKVIHPSLGQTPTVWDSLKDLAIETPLLTLGFFSCGVILEKDDPHQGKTSYLVSPEDVAKVLGMKSRYTTGLLPADILLVQGEGSVKLTVSWRKPQKTGLWLEGSETPLVIPLPGLVLLRRQTAQRSSYALFALGEKQKPESFDVALSVAPFPHVGSSGSICWGEVKRPKPQSKQSNDLSPIWDALLGSFFGSHNCGGKSKTYPDDIRQHYLALEKRKARVYPQKDLCPAGYQTLADAIMWYSR